MNFEEWKTLLSSSNPSDRAEAADLVPNDGDDQAIAALLLECLDDVNPTVRVCAIDTLADFPDAEVAARLCERLAKESDELVKGYIADSLGHMGALEYLKPIIELLEKETSAQIRIRAAAGLLYGTLEYVWRDLERHCRHNDWRVRNPAFSALDAVVDQVADTLARAKALATEQQAQDQPAIAAEHIRNILERE